MTNDELAKLVLKHLADFREEVNTRFDTAEKSHESLVNILDMHTNMLETDEQERLALSAQVSRHQDWIERAGPKLKIDMPKA